MKEDARRSADLPLAGVRVLAIEQYGAGPYATMVLADLGADVIKIEQPGAGEIGRAVPPWTAEADSLFFQSLNRGKRSMVIDLKHPEGKAVFQRLVAGADVVFSNTRGGAPERLGITYAHLKQHNPAIVCAFLTGFGRTGPRADEPGYDYIVQSLTGIAALGGEPGGPPARAGVSVVDFSAGLAAAVGILAGLTRAREFGVGCDVDASLFSTALSLTNYLASWTLTRGYVPERLPHGAHPSIVPSQFFEAADGWLMVMCQTNAFYHELIARSGLTQLENDPRFTTMEGRLEHKAELLAALERRFSELTVSEWLDRLEGAVPIAPVNGLPAALADRQVEALGLIVDYDHPQFGTVRQVTGPVQTSAGQRAPTPAPRLGQDTAAVLKELTELSDLDIDALFAAGVVESERHRCSTPAGGGRAGSESHGGGRKRLRRRRSSRLHADGDRPVHVWSGGLGLGDDLRSQDREVRTYRLLGAHRREDAARHVG